MSHMLSAPHKVILVVSTEVATNEYISEKLLSVMVCYHRLRSFLMKLMIIVDIDQDG